MWCLPRWRSVRSAVASTVESISRARFLCSHVPPSMMPRSASSVVSPLSSRSARDWYSRRLVDDQGERARAATRITIHTHPKCLCAPNPPLVLEVGGVCRGTISLSRVADALLEQLHFTLHFQLPTRHGVLRLRQRQAARCRVGGLPGRRSGYATPPVPTFARPLICLAAARNAGRDGCRCGRGRRDGRTHRWSRSSCGRGDHRRGARLLPPYVDSMGRVSVSDDVRARKRTRYLARRGFSQEVLRPFPRGSPRPAAGADAWLARGSSRQIPTFGSSEFAATRGAAEAPRRKEGRQEQLGSNETA